MDAHRGWFDATVAALGRGIAGVKALVDRNVRRASLKVEMATLRRQLDEVARDVGRIAVDRLRERGQVVPDDVAHLLRRTDELEDRIASAERRLIDLERDPPPAASAPALDADATQPSPRTRPSFAPRPPGS